MEDEEGAFVACSFWLVSTLTYVGQLDRARALMEESLKEANDLGLFSEQIVPTNADFLGNIP